MLAVAQRMCAGMCPVDDTNETQAEEAKASPESKPLLSAQDVDDFLFSGDCLSDAAPGGAMSLAVFGPA